MLLLGIALGVVIGFALRGKFTNLADLKFQDFFLIIVSLVAQLLILASPLSRNSWVIENGALLYVLSLVILLLGLLYNWKLGWAFWLVILGAALNFLVITQNQGTIPVDLEKLSVVSGDSLAQLQAEFASKAELSYRHALNPDSKLPWLGDVIYIPLPLFNANVYSLGDIFIALGMAAFVPQVMLGKFSPRPPSAPAEIAAAPSQA